jgi:hypothetical protein
LIPGDETHTARVADVARVGESLAAYSFGCAETSETFQRAIKHHHTQMGDAWFHRF